MKAKDSELGNLLAETCKTNRLLIELLLGGKTQMEQVKSLDRVGYSPSEIAEIIGTTRNTVSVTLVRLRRRPRRKP